jgi:hypothetical protein
MNLNYAKLVSFIKISLSDVLLINILIILYATVYVSAAVDEIKMKAHKTINHYSENRLKQKDSYNIRNVKNIIEDSCHLNIQCNRKLIN